MSVFLKPFAGVLAVALVFIAVVALGDVIEARLEAWSHSWDRSKRRMMRLGALFVGILALVLLSPAPVAIGIVCCSSVLLLWVFDQTHLRQALLLFAGAVAVMLLGLAFYRPEKLATVTIQTKTGNLIKGDLITSASGTWYLGKAHRNFVAVLPDTVRSVRIRSAKHSEPQSTVA